MVCDRCIKAVRDTLESAGLGPVHVRLGEAEFENNLSDEEKSSASDDKIYNQVKEEATEEVMDKIEKLYNNKNVDKIRIEVGVAWPYGNHNYTKPGEKLVGSKIAYINKFNFTREDYKDFLKQYKEEN